MIKGELIYQDYNFFSVSKNLRKKSRMIIALYTLITLVYISAVAGYYYFTEGYVHNLSRETDEYLSYLNSAETDNNIRAVHELRQKLDDIKDYNSKLNIAINDIETSSAINSSTVNIITSALPREVSFDNMQMDNEKVMITGFAVSRQDIAEFVNNLEETGAFHSNYITTITTLDKGYSFILECTLKDVS